MPKRLLDIVGGLAGLVLLLPAFVAISVWIKLDSTGPVFFRQERVGRFGRTFRIFKFRTMTADPGGRALQITVGRDRRITRAGAVLRRFKLDELPQLINVVVGEMSLVGPRPEVPRYVAHYTDEQKSLILSIRPGITDPASIAFADENVLLAAAEDPERTYITEVLPRKLHLYAHYVTTRSFWGDVGLIFQTLSVAVIPSLRRSHMH